jgi:hypothetical protein
MGRAHGDSLCGTSYNHHFTQKLIITSRVYLNIINQLPNFQSKVIPGVRFIPFIQFFYFAGMISPRRNADISRYLESRGKLRRQFFVGRYRADRIVEFCEMRRSFAREGAVSTGKVETPTAAATSSIEEKMSDRACLQE